MRACAIRRCPPASAMQSVVVNESARDEILTVDRWCRRCLRSASKHRKRCKTRTGKVLPMYTRDCSRGSRVSTIERKTSREQKDESDDDPGWSSHVDSARGAHHVIRGWRWPTLAGVGDHRVTSPSHRVLRGGPAEGLQPGKHISLL